MDKKAVTPTQTVLLFQGGGALGAYQAGVYAGAKAAEMEPTWVIGTSIGAINAAIIAGNRPERRLEYLHEFWARMGQGWFADDFGDHPAGNSAATWVGSMNALNTIALGLPGFFTPRWGSGFHLGWPVAAENAGLYDCAPLRTTLEELIDFDYLTRSSVRLSIGAVDIESGRMRYFDSAVEPITVSHILASGALPPAFPPVEIDGRHYWDGGIHSNTPLEWMLRDNPRRHSVCFMATLWPQAGGLPASLPEVLCRHKELQYASRAEALIEMERELHRLRHGISQLAKRLPDDARADREIARSIELGCRSVYHLVRLQAPRLDHENHTKDIDFVPTRIEARWQVGKEDMLQALSARVWETPVGPDEGIVLHDFSRRTDHAETIESAESGLAA